MIVHCCQSMIDAYDRNLSALKYIAPERYYYIQDCDDSRRNYRTDGISGYSIQFCPFCGTKLPEALTDVMYDLLKYEYGIEHPERPNDKQRIPSEFLSDEWWKKRGL
jgi:hypothetical protein